jgi:hypothetical protein
MPADPVTEVQQAVLPNNCVLAFGLPTTEEDFEASIRDQNRDYAKHYLAGWEQYRRNYACHVIAFTQRFLALGVQVISDLRGSDLPALFDRGSVVTLFTHWTATGIEFFDGTLPLSKVVEAVPCAFAGVLDLCVCHPDELVALLLRDRPLCSVRYLSERASPVFWLTFYAALYSVLKLGGRTYTNAMTEVIIELRHQSANEK